MNCHQVLQSVSAFIDGELAAEDRIALEAHLAGCAECRSLAEQLRLDDAALLRAFAPCRRASERVGSGVIEQLGAAPPFPSRRSSRSPAISKSRAAEWNAEHSPPASPAAGVHQKFRWSLVTGAAAGFLLAVLLFRPWEAPRERIVRDNAAASGSREASGALRQAVAGHSPAGPPSVARLTVATGDVHWQRPDGQSWQAFTADAAIIPGSRLRTNQQVRCELETKDGGLIRLDAGTQVRFLSENKLELAQGQIACVAPPDGQFEVVASEVSGGLSRGQAALWSCPTPELAQVTCSTGSLELSVGEDRHVIEHGETVRLLNGKLVKAEKRQDPVLVTSWIHSLLVLKGHGNEELRQRVDHLLAGIGRAKLSYLYEQEIRSLGEYGAVPLLEYVRSDDSRKEPVRRRKAMRIVADLAPPGAVGRLVDLLPDDDPQVRFHAARGLERLTGKTFARSPEQWRNEDAESGRAALAAWKSWLRENKRRLPVHGTPQEKSNRTEAPGKPGR